MQRLRVVIGVLLLVGRAADTAPAHCSAKDKGFQCHRLALNAHLGLDGPVDLAGAKALYAEACAKGQPQSCNNLAVLALVHPELGNDVDPTTMFARACQRLDRTACDNARRFATAKELAIQLAFVDSELTVDAKTWGDLMRAACRAGDVFRCDDSVSRERVATALANECRAGAHETCVDAATRASDEESFASLMAIACNAHEGKACHALATRKAAAGASDTALASLWQGACTDDDFDATDEDATARSEACARWGKATKQTAIKLRVAKIAAGYCSTGKARACEVAEDLYDRAGDGAKAFAVAKQQCDGGNAAACRDVAERYVLAKGTPASIDKGLEILGGTCPDDLAWPTCKVIGHYLEAHHRRPVAAASYASYCKTGNDEACYLRARVLEDDGDDGACNGDATAFALKTSYDALCKRNFGDSCRRSAGMCARAMADFAKPEKCGSGIGDGTERFGLHYHQVVALCPKESWTPAVRAAMNKIDISCKQFEAPGGHCER